MNIEFSSVLFFILALLYLIMLPGYLILISTKIHNFDIIETLSASFGIGVGVLTVISIVLGLPGSAGLTFVNLVLANALALIVIIAWRHMKSGRKKEKRSFSVRK